MSQESDFSDDGPQSWIQWFCSIDEHSFLCEVNEEYIRQPLNLHGLKNKIKNFNKALEMILRSRSPQENEIQKKEFLELYQEATELYGLIHSRYIVTPEGLGIMRQRFLTGRFGQCPRVLCEKQNALPIGISEDTKISRVKIYCPCCKDIYTPKKSYPDLDGAFFGTSFPHLLLMTYSDFHIKSPRQSYTPTIFGFPIEERKEEQRNLVPSEQRAEPQLELKAKSEIGTSAETKSLKKKKKQ